MELWLAIQSRSNKWCPIATGIGEPWAVNVTFYWLSTSNIHLRNSTIEWLYIYILEFVEIHLLLSQFINICPEPVSNGSGYLLINCCNNKEESGWRLIQTMPLCVCSQKNTLQWRDNERDGVSNHQPHDCLLNHLFRHWWKKTSKLRTTGLCEGTSPVTGEFPTQRASNAQHVTIWWRNHELFSGEPQATTVLFWCIFYLFLWLIPDIVINVALPAHSQNIIGLLHSVIVISVQFQYTGDTSNTKI